MSAVKKKTVNKAINQLKKNYAKTARATLPEKLLKHKFPKISKKLRRGFTYDVYRGTKFFKGFLKNLKFVGGRRRTRRGHRRRRRHYRTRRCRSRRGRRHTRRRRRRCR